MSTFVLVMIAFSGISFVAYRIGRLVSNSTRAEFEGFRLARYWSLVNWLEQAIRRAFLFVG